MSKSKLALAFSLGVWIGFECNDAETKYLETKFVVGQCVRNLGEPYPGKITAIAPNGGIEVRYENGFNPENPILQAYNRQQQETLIKVECK